MLKKYFSIFIFCTVILLVKSELRKGSNKLPNILLLLADDVGYGDMNFLGNSIFNTSNLNEMSKKGTILDNLYSPTPLCSPSRAGILTGRHPVRYGVAGNYSEDPFYATEGVFYCNADKGLPQTEKTIAQHLNETGYDSYIIGKWHLGQKCEYLPHTFGFKEFYGIPYALSEGTFKDMELKDCKETIATMFACPPIPLMFSSRNIESDTCSIVKQPVKREEVTDLYLDRFKQNIQDSVKNEKPFFMFMSFAQAHIDCNTTTFFSKNEFLTDDEHYRASIHEMDYMVGEINDFLKKMNLLEDTLIFFTSDNGNPSYNRDHEDGVPAYQGSNGPFNGIWSSLNQKSSNTGRCSTWEGGMRVPGFVVWEGHQDIIKPDSISHQIYSSMDILPTVLNLVKKSVPTNLDGKNILENLYEPVITNRFIHFYRGGAFYALRYGKWKFHLFTRPGEECGFVWSMFKWEFPPLEHKSLLIFDLNQDPQERRPLKTEVFIKKYPKIYEEVLAEIKSHRESMKNAPPSILELMDENSKVCCDKSKNCHCD